MASFRDAGHVQHVTDANRVGEVGLGHSFLPHALAALLQVAIVITLAEK